MINKLFLLLINIIFIQGYIVFQERIDDLKHVRNSRNLKIEFITIYENTRTFHARKIGTNYYYFIIFPTKQTNK